MQKLIRMIVGVVLFSGFAAWSADTPAANTAAQKQTTSVDDKTKAQAKDSVVSASAKTEKIDHNFEDLLVQGKYHFSDEAVTTVEEDKVLDSLLGVRTDFKDKIEQSVGRY